MQNTVWLYILKNKISRIIFVMNSTSVVKQYVCQNVVGWYLYIYDLFINVVSSSDHIGSIGRRITELKFMLKALTNDCSLI